MSELHEGVYVDHLSGVLLTTGGLSVDPRVTDQILPLGEGP